jgi:hypothetical protein
VFKGLWVRFAERAQGRPFPETPAGGFTRGKDIATDFEVKRSKRRRQGGQIWFTSRQVFNREVGGKSGLGRARGEPSWHLLEKEAFLEAQASVWRGWNNWCGCMERRRDVRSTKYTISSKKQASRRLSAGVGGGHLICQGRQAD